MEGGVFRPPFVLPIAQALSVPGRQGSQHCDREPCDASSLQNIDPTYGYFFLEQFHAVRNDPGFIWRLEDSAGILTFPSAHAAVAALCAWALWPIRILRYPALALNLAMGFSAIPGANHYVVDVIAGVVVALAAIGFVAFATGSSRQKSLARPAPVGSVLVRSRS